VGGVTRFGGGFRFFRVFGVFKLKRNFFSHMGVGNADVAWAMNSIELLFQV